MSTTLALVSPATSPFASTIDVLPAATVANFVTVAPPKVPTGVDAARYVYNAGAAADPVYLEVRREYVAKTNELRCSLRLSTYIRKSVSETGEVSDHPVEAVFSFNTEGKYMTSEELTFDVVVMLCGIIMNVNAAENPSSNVIQQLNRGVLDHLFD